MATEIKSTSIKSQNIIAEPQVNKPGSPEAGQIIQATGTGDIAKGIYHYTGESFFSLDNAQGDLETLRLVLSTDTSAVGFSSALNSTSTLAGNTNAVPHETSTGTGLLGALEIPSTGGDALLTEFDANKVFRYFSAGANNNNDYFGIPIDIPAQTRGQNIVIKFKYRTEEASAATSDGDFQVSIWDKTNGVSTTQASTLTTGTTISAGSNILMTAKTNLAVGDKIWFETGGTGSTVGNVANSLTQAYITSISSTDNNITVSEDVQVIASGKAVTGWLSDKTSGLLPAADSDTNKVGKDFSIAVKTEETTAQIVLWISNKSVTTNVIELFFDGILVSQNKFLQASSQTKGEYYFAKGDSTFWNTTSSSSGWETDKLAVGHSSPPIADSKYLTFTEESTSLTRVYAKQDISLDVTFFATCTAGNQLILYNSDDEAITQAQTPDGATASSTVNVTSSIQLAKDDYIYATNNAGSNRYGGATFLAKPQTSDVILLESQDEIFTDWNDWTPSFATANWAGGGANDVKFAKWRRVGSDIEVKITFAVSSTGSASTNTAAIPLPDGYSVDISQAHQSGTDDGQIVGRYFRIRDTNNFYNAGTATSAAGIVYVTETGALGLSYSNSNDTNINTGITIADLDSTSGHSFYIEYKVPIQGFNSNFNPLLSMPLVEIGSDHEDFGRNNFGGYASSYAPYLTGTDQNFDNTGNIISIVNTSTEGLKITALVDCFLNCNTIFQFSTANSGHAGWVKNNDIEAITSVDKDKFISPQGYIGSTIAQNGGITVPVINYPLKAGDYVRLLTDGDAFNTADANTRVLINALRDRGNTNMAHIIKPAVAIIQDEKPSNTASGDATSGGWNTRDLTVIKGESWFVTLSSNKFTLEPGTYEIFATAPFYKCEELQLRLYDVTNSTAAYYGQTQYARSANYGSLTTNLMAYTSITSSTEYRLEYQVGSTSTTNGLGAGANSYGGTMIYSQIKIRKLK
jgi:hypothetical protein